jgi:hypothetical protein
LLAAASHQFQPQAFNNEGFPGFIVGGKWCQLGKVYLRHSADGYLQFFTRLIHSLQASTGFF